MTVFLISLLAVAVLLLLAVPGYVMKKLGILPEECISGFSKLLVYFAQPCLIVYTFMNTEYTPERMVSIGWFALACLAIHVIMMGGSYILYFEGKT